MNDWATFIDDISWFLNDNAVVQIAPKPLKRKYSPQYKKLFPRFAELLSLATITEVTVDGKKYELFAWDSTEGGRTGWLCLPPTTDAPESLYIDHKQLLTTFGGIVERFNEPEDTWLMNLNEALTAQEAAHDAGFIKEYIWIFENAGTKIPIELSDYYSIAREANGNTTLCHRHNGDVLMFATDHNFDHITALEGCPENSLYRLNDVTTFRDWVDTIADQWLSNIENS